MFEVNHPSLETRTGLASIIGMEKIFWITSVPMYTAYFLEKSEMHIFFVFLIAACAAAFVNEFYEDNLGLDEFFNPAEDMQQLNQTAAGTIMLACCGLGALIAYFWLSSDHFQIMLDASGVAGSAKGKNIFVALLELTFYAPLFFSPMILGFIAFFGCVLIIEAIAQSAGMTLLGNDKNE